MKKTPLLEASLCYNIHDGRIEQAHIQRPIAASSCMGAAVDTWICACKSGT